MKKDRINEIWGVAFLLLGLFTLASLIFYHSGDIPFYTSHPANPIQNYTGLIGAYVAFGLFLTFGISAYIIPALFLLWSSCFFLQSVPERKFFKFAGLAMALFSAATLVTISVDSADQFTSGGVIGYLAGSHLLRYFGQIGSYIVAGACLMLSLLLATDFLIYPLVRDLFENLKEWSLWAWDNTEEWREEMAERFFELKDRILGASEEEEEEEEEEEDGEEEEVTTRRRRKPKKTKTSPALKEDTPIKVKKYDPSVSEAAEKLKQEQQALAQGAEQKPKKKVKLKYEPEEADEELEASSSNVVGSDEREEDETPYALPDIELLKKPTAAAKQTDDLQGNSKILERTLDEFGISVKVTEVEQGPVITRYELMPAPGVKVNSIAALSDDIALALKARSVRLIIPIPGKSAVGVEVPNSVSNVVSLREMIESNLFQSRSLKLPLVLGKAANGQPIIADLTKMPHILIAGSTGSGKTVCVNSIIMGLLYHYTPEDLKFVMVDPKMVELTGYNAIPHMLTPVVTDTKKASHTLNWVVSEMENRYQLFATVGVRNIESFNEREMSEEAEEAVEGVESKNVIPRKLPYIVVVIDELADLMLVARDKVEGVILRLAQLARAVGIHLILATQRPSVDVITGVIKANFPARISFKVASKVDSRTVLDAIGADKLIGRGDMLVLQPGDPKPVRGQAPLVTDGEINDVVKCLAKQGAPEFRAEITKAQEGRTAGGATEKDELFDEAVQVILETRQASTSNLQRRLRLGYTRAARIIDQIEAEGLIGPAQGSKPRDIYVGQEDTEAVER